MQPDVSIIVAAYNAAGTIERALESARASLGVSLEIVVADDASTDNTAAVVAALGADRVRLVRGAVNQGPGAARNMALEDARGRYVSILDADDLVLPDRLRRVVARLDASDATMALDGVEIVDDAGTRTVMEGLAGRPAGARIDLADYARKNVLFRSKHTLGYFKPTIRTAFLQQTGIRYAEELRIGEDFHLVAQILASGGTCVVEPETGYRYRITAGSISRVLRLDHVRAMRAADERFLREYELSPAAQEAFRERRCGFDDAEAFLLMVDAMKKRDLVSFLRNAVLRPAAMSLFRMPIGKRLRSLVPNTRSALPKVS